MKRILVDMSATILHYGHTRLLSKAKDMGYVIVALATDEEITKYKGYQPELNFEQRKEMLLALKSVDEVISAPWLIDQSFFDSTGADILLHAGESPNSVQQTLTIEKTPDISSHALRNKTLSSLVQQHNTERCFLTPGPGNLQPENLLNLSPAFSRNDSCYTHTEESVLGKILSIAGQEQILAIPGSATNAIEIATTNFLFGKVLVVLAGFYSQRILRMLERKKDLLNLTQVQGISYTDFLENSATLSTVDWVVSVYTETANAFLCDIKELRRISDKLHSKLMLDATGSINLEENHELADVCIFSSCKGLSGLVGAGFMTFNNNVLSMANDCQKSFTLDISTYLEKKITPPIHAISSLSFVSSAFHDFRASVCLSKKIFMEAFAPHIDTKNNQPNLCTKISGSLHMPSYIIPYQPRIIDPGHQIICHLFDGCLSNRKPGELYKSIRIV